MEIRKAQTGYKVREGETVKEDGVFLGVKFMERLNNIRAEKLPFDLPN